MLNSNSKTKTLYILPFRSSSLNGLRNQAVGYPERGFSGVPCAATLWFRMAPTRVRYAGRVPRPPLWGHRPTAHAYRMRSVSAATCPTRSSTVHSGLPLCCSRSVVCCAAFATAAAQRPLFVFWAPGGAGGTCGQAATQPSPTRHRHPAQGGPSL